MGPPVRRWLVSALAGLLQLGCGKFTSDTPAPGDDSLSSDPPQDSCADVIDGETVPRSLCESECERAAEQHPNPDCGPRGVDGECVDLCLQKTVQTELSCARAIARSIAWYDEGPHLGGDCLCCLSQWHVPSAEGAGNDCEHTVQCRIEFRRNTPRPDAIGRLPKEEIAMPLSNARQFAPHPEGFLIAGGTQEAGDSLVTVDRMGNIVDLQSLSSGYSSSVIPLLRVADGSYLFRHGGIQRYAPPAPPELVLEGPSASWSLASWDGERRAMVFAQANSDPDQIHLFDTEGAFAETLSLPDRASQAIVTPAGDVFTASPVEVEVTYSNDFLLRRYARVGPELDEQWARTIPGLPAPQGGLTSDDNSLIVLTGTEVHRISFDGELIFSTDTEVPTARYAVDSAGAVYVAWTTRGDATSSVDDPLNPDPNCSPHGCDGATLVKVDVTGRIEWEYQRRNETSQVIDIALVPEPALLIVSTEESESIQILLFDE